MTISTLVSNIGGFFSLIVMLINYIIFKYQFFKYETSIMKRIYHQDKILKKDSRKSMQRDLLEREVAKSVVEQDKDETNEENVNVGI